MPISTNISVHPSLFELSTTTNIYGGASIVHSSSTRLNLVMRSSSLMLERTTSVSMHLISMRAGEDKHANIFELVEGDKNTLHR
jgi:hypothetical protein